MNMEPVLPEYRRSLSGTLGEFVTEQLLERNGVPTKEAERAAAGWGGDRYELWGEDPDSVLVVRWRWDTPQDASEFETALRKVKFRNYSAIDNRNGVITLALASISDLPSRAAGGP
jgi:hypothetical protein